MAISRGLNHRLQSVRLLVCDVDGVLTDGRIILNNFGHETKFFSVTDGLGFTLAQNAGLPVAWLSARRSQTTARRAKQCGVKWLIQGQRRKAEGLAELCRRAGVALTAAAFVGDDLVDLPAMQAAGLAVAVANAAAEVKAAAHYVTQASGGAGAVREVIEMILQAQKTWASAVGTLLDFHAAKN